MSRLSMCLFLWGAALLTSAAPVVAQQTAPAASMPPGEGQARERLDTSPRHGEMIDVPLDDHTLQSWIVYPERSDKAPVVIVIHEIYGLTDWIRSVADQLAADGFIAIAPDLLSGMGPGGGGTNAFEGRDAVVQAVRGLDNETVVKRLNAVKEYALGLPAAGETYATVGYCWGGSTSFYYATQQPELDAAVVYYGTAPEEKSLLENVEAPVLGLYGEDDARVTSTVEATKEAMQGAGKTFESHIYERAGHGFLRAQDQREGANEKAAMQAWPKTIRFLREHLGEEAE